METKSRCAQLLAPLAAIAVLWTMPAAGWAGEIYVTSYSAAYETGMVGAYSTSGATINASLVPEVGELFSEPIGIAISGSDLLVPGRNSGGSPTPQIGEYDAGTGATINLALISPGSGPDGTFEALAVSGSDVFTTLQFGGIVGEYTTAGATVNATFATLPFDAMAIAASGGDLFVVGNGAVAEFDASTGEEISASFVPGVAHPSNVALWGGDLYVLSVNPGTIGEYNASTGAVINASLVTGLNHPGTIAVSGGDIFVTYYEAGTIGEYDATTGATINASLITGLTDPNGIVVVTPEPATWIMLAVGAAGLLACGRRKRHPAIRRNRVRGTRVSLAGPRFVLAILCVPLAAIAALRTMPAAVSAGEIYVTGFSDPTDPIGTVVAYSTSGGTINAALVTDVGESTTVPIGIAISGSDLFVPNQGTGGLPIQQIGEYDAATGAAINAGLISTGGFFEALATSGPDLFTTFASSGTIGEYTTSGATVNAAFATLPFVPNAIAVSGGDLFVVAGGAIAEYDTTTGEEISASFVPGVAHPADIVVSGDDLYVLGVNPGTVGEYSATTGAAINASLVTGLQRPSAIAVSGGDIFVTSESAGTVAEYDATTGATINAALITGLTDPTGIVVVTPEPATWIMLAIGAAGLLAYWRRTRRSAPQYRARRGDAENGRTRMRRSKLAFTLLAMFAWALAASRSHAQTLTTLHSFDYTDGYRPLGSLTLSGSTLYGTTSGGGPRGEGTVFSLPVTGGTPTTLAAFDSLGDGGQPTAGLALIGSTLYGTTQEGGSRGDGVVFSVPETGGASAVVASFNEFYVMNGDAPRSDLTLSGDGSTFYGTTYQGGVNGYSGGIGGDGTIFSVPVAGGTPTTLVSFNGTDGENPWGDLTLSANGSTLYGMTQLGGTNNDGVIFSVPVTGGTPTVLFSFDGTNGADPFGGLLLTGSTLYGMTIEGGANNDGTIFSIPVTGGTPTTLFSFNGTNGEFPSGSLTLSADGSTFYGMTTGNGLNVAGTIFSIPVAGGPLTTLVMFNGKNGEQPYGSLTLNGSTLYGTTAEGGANNDGTVFALLLPEPSSVVLLGLGAIGLGAMALRRKRMRQA